MIPYDPSKPLLSLHVAKCGGNSVAQLLGLFFGRRLYTHYRGPEGALPPRHELAPRTCVHGHFENAWRTGVFDYYPQATQFITVLREPLEICLSWYSFAKGKKNNPLAREHNPWLAEIDDDLSRYLERAIALGEERQRQGAAEARDGRFAHQTGSMLEFLPFTLTLDTFEACLDEHFVYIGTTDAMQTSAVALARALGFYPRQINARNASLRDLSIASPWRAAFRRAHELEYAVYDYAVRQHAPPAHLRHFSVACTARPRSAQADFVQALATPDCEVELREQPTAGAQQATAVASVAIAAAAARGVRRVSFGRLGHEPTHVAELLELIATARRLGIERTVLHTDAVALADPSYVRALAQAGLTHVVMSLLALDEPTGDGLGGAAGATAAKLRALAHCLTTGLALHVSIVLTRPGLPGIGALAGFVDDAARRTERLRYAGRFLDRLALVREQIRVGRAQVLYPSLPELKDALGALGGQLPNWFVVGRDLPLCYPLALAGCCVVALDDAPLPFDLEALPTRCDACPVHTHCPMWRRLHPLRVRGRWLKREEELEPTLRALGLELFDIRVAEGAIRLCLGDQAHTHELVLEPLARGGRAFVAGRRLGLSHTCACAPEPRAARALLGLFDHATR